MPSRTAQRSSRTRLAAAGAALAVAAAAGVVAVAVAGGANTGAPLPCTGCVGYATAQPLREPNRLVSENGRLTLTLTAGLSTVDIGGKRVQGEVYNGQLPGPTLVVDPGDQMDVLLRNRLTANYLPYGASASDPPPQVPGQPYAGYAQPLGNITNLHVHGLHVSPKPPSDDVLLSVRPGGQYQYRYAIPRTHPSGLYWYHPHGHEYTDMQVSQGQAGTIIIRGGLDDLPGIRELRDRLLVIQNVQVKDGRLTSGQYQVPAYRLLTVNGQVQPVVDIRPGESQRLRIANESTERFLRLQLPGNAEWWKLAVDGTTLEYPMPIRRIRLAPGQRMEVLVRAGARSGSAGIVQEWFSQRPTPYGKQPRRLVWTLRVAGEAVAPRPLPERLLPVRDIRGDAVRIARKQTITLTQSPPKFYVNGQMFHMGHGKTGARMAGPTFTVRLGTVEEWKIVNNSPEWHSFHIHVDDYQVVARNGRPVAGQPEWADSVGIAPHQSVTVRIPFEDFTGTFVFHCHVLVHEDRGMMAIVKVVP